MTRPSPQRFVPTAKDFSYSRLISYAALQWPGYRDAPHHRLIARKLEAVERYIIEATGVYAPFAQHGGTGSAGVAKGLIGKTNINTAFLVCGSQARYRHFAADPSKVEAGDKKICGTDVETNVYLESVYNEAVARIAPTGSQNSGPACFKALGW